MSRAASRASVLSPDSPKVMASHSFLEFAARMTLGASKINAHLFFALLQLRMSTKDLAGTQEIRGWLNLISQLPWFGRFADSWRRASQSQGFKSTEHSSLWPFEIATVVRPIMRRAVRCMWNILHKVSSALSARTEAVRSVTATRMVG